jgi:hypothetical protein
MPPFLNASDTPLDKTSRTDLDDSTCGLYILLNEHNRSFHFCREVLSTHSFLIQFLSKIGIHFLHTVIHEE